MARKKTDTDSPKDADKAGTKRRAAAPRRRRSRMIALEPRILFDGAMAVDIAQQAAAPADAPVADAPAAEAASLTPATFEAPGAQKPAAGTPADAVADSDLDRAVVRDGAAPVRQEIVFVDPTVANFQTLINGIDNPNVRIVILDTNRDGLQQIADALRQQGKVDAIHLISHGAEGQVNVGSTVLSAETMKNYAELNRERSTAVIAWARAWRDR